MSSSDATADGAFASERTDPAIAGRVFVTIGLMLSSLMNTIDSTIANVALPHIQGSVSASQDEITWVLTSYIVAAALMTPLSGWLALKIGRRPLFLASIVGFVIASVLCGMASSLPEIVGFRLLQGVAGAAMIPLSQAMIMDLWPGVMATRVMSIWAAVIMAGPILGPTVGGYLTESFSWRWCFYVNVPVGIAAFAMMALFMRRDDGAGARRFDALGFASLAIGLCAIQLMFDRGSGQDWFDSMEIWTEALVGVCALWVFFAHSMTTDHPFFHRDLMRDRNFVSCAIFSFFVMATSMITTALLPSFMQTLMGYSALQSGMASTSRGIGSLLAFLTVPWIQARIGPRTTMALGLVLSIIALVLMQRFDLSMTDQPIVISGFIQGMGVGFTFSPLSVLCFSTLDPSLRTEAAVVYNMVRTIGGSLGISVLQAILIRDSAAAHAALAEHVRPDDPLVRWAMPSALNAPGLEAVNAEVTRQGAMIGYIQVFGWLTLLCVLLLPLLLIMRPAKSGVAMKAEVHGE